MMERLIRTDDDQLVLGDQITEDKGIEDDKDENDGTHDRPFKGISSAFRKKK